MLEFILFAILGFYLLGYLGRLLLRIWIRRQQKKFGNDPGAFYRTYTWGAGQRKEQHAERKEGEIFVDQSLKTEKKVKGSVGDYVEYEEVEITEQTQTDQTGKE